jgi:hypothetical protein
MRLQAFGDGERVGDRRIVEQRLARVLDRPRPDWKRAVRAVGSTCDGPAQ